MAQESLEQKLQKHKSPFDMLYNSPAEVFQFPLKPEFSNWRDEQRAWKESAVFMNMSFHMTDVQLQGPEVYKFLSSLGINSFENFGPMQAKQFVACNHDGYVVGDGILICEEENKVNLLGRPSVVTWVAFHAQTGSHDVEILELDRPSPNLSERGRFRYQVQGPNAMEILEEVNGGPLPEIKFFKMGRFKVGDHQVTALNHRMTGAPGFEFWGPSAEGEEVKAILLKAGKKYGITQIGGRVYPCTAIESGWMGGPVPAVYTGEEAKGYREWLPAISAEGAGSLGGSFYTENIEDLYVSPYDLGYGFMIKFDHDFIGREALEKMADKPKRKKVRFEWNEEDIKEIQASMYNDGDRFKYMEAPAANYSTFSCDEVLLDGDRVGISSYPMFSDNINKWISLGSVREDLAVEGKELIVTWGEPDGGSAKPTVERHIQKAVRVTVDPKPVKRD